MHASRTHRGLGALLAAALAAVALFSVSAATQAPSAHAASGGAAARLAGSGTVPKGVDTSQAALRAAAHRYTKTHSGAVARAAGFFPFSFSFYGGGAVLSIDRSAACSVVNGYTDVANAIAATVLIPFPWNLLAIAALSNFRNDIRAQMGAQGVNIYFNWWGSVSAIVPLGGYQRC
jgi:hypothetical protein